MRIVELASQRGASAFFVARLCRAIFYCRKEHTMPDYEYLYHLMVAASEDAITAMEGGNVWDAKRILISAEQRAEEAYLTSAD